MPAHPIPAQPAKSGCASGAAPSALAHVSVCDSCERLQEVEIERRLRVQAAAEESERRRHFAEMQRQFISMVSHEFRTPLTAIQGANFLLEKHLKKLPAEATAAMSRLLRLQAESLRTMHELVDQVLVLNCLDHMWTEQKLRPIDVGEMLVQLAGTFNRTMAQARVELQNTLPPRRCLPSDEKLLRSAIENLISNGLKYSPEAAPVVVRVALAAESWVISVTDRGRGIPVADQTRLYEPFFRSSNVGPVPGTGLGLTIVRRVVDFLGGEIAFTSVDGEGTCFSLKFPLPADPFWSNHDNEPDSRPDPVGGG